MRVMALLLLSIAGSAGIWLWREGVLAAPALQTGDATAKARGRDRMAVEKTGLVVFLVVVSCLFVLLSAAYFMRMESSDWRPFAHFPRVLWLNTVVLALSSIALEIASAAAVQSDRKRTLQALILGQLGGFAFLFGQAWAWNEMFRAGFYAQLNPANAFFYLLTGLHALHLTGGVFAISIVCMTAVMRFGELRVASVVSNCALYWHFLFALWLVLFALLFGVGEEIGVICRRLIG